MLQLWDGIFRTHHHRRMWRSLWARDILWWKRSGLEERGENMQRILVGDVNFGWYLVMWANHSQILSEYSSTCRQMRTRMSFSFTSLVLTTDHDDEHKKKIECNHAFDLVANSIKQVNNSPQYIQVWKVEWKNMFWHCLIAQVETAKECAKQCADEAQCNGWSHFAPAKRWTHTSYLSRTPRTASV